MEKFLTKENLIIIALVFYTLVQSNFFATKLDLEQLRGEVLKQKNELQTYSDQKDNELMQKIDEKYEKIITKLDKLR